MDCEADPVDDPGPHQIGCCLTDVHRLQRDRHVDRRIWSGHRELARGAEVDGDDGPLVDHCLPVDSGVFTK